MQFDNPELKEKHLRACYAKNANHTNKIWINKNGKNNLYLIKESHCALIGLCTKNAL